MQQEKLDESLIGDEVWPGLDDPQKNLLQSQQGLFAYAPFTALPHIKGDQGRPTLTFPLVPTSTLLLFCFHALPMWPATIVQRALRSQFPLECAIAQVCREAGARVATNVVGLQRSGQPEAGSSGGLSETVALCSVGQSRPCCPC